MRAWPSARHARRLDIFLAPLDQGGGADGAGVIGPLHGDEGDDDLASTPCPKTADQDEGDEDRGKRELEVDQAHDRSVSSRAADIGREQAEGPADEEGEHGDPTPTPSSNAHAIENADSMSRP